MPVSARLSFSALLLTLPLLLLIAGTAMAQSPERPPANTGYMVLERSEVPVALQLTGRAVAANTAQIRPRVSGMIREIVYTPGSYVEAGAELFKIDPLTYEIAVQVAEATLARAEADLSTAQSAFDRAERLQGSATSRASVEAIQTTLLKARASREEALANLTLAKTQLDWTTLRAPAAGIAGIAEVAVGDLVSASQAAALTEIVQTDPILVDLTEPYPLRLQLEAAAAEGRVTLGTPALALTLNDGRRIEAQAKLLSSGATVSATTGTRRLRFEMPNPTGQISPGMFVQGDLTLGSTAAILVPQRAAVRLRDGSLTAWIADNGKASRRKITESGTHGSNWVITSGLTEGEWLLVDGLNNLRDGQAINPIPALIDDAGVVRDADAKVGN